MKRHARDFVTVYVLVLQVTSTGWLPRYRYIKGIAGTSLKDVVAQVSYECQVDLAELATCNTTMER